ncbi:hypothetical protein [Anaerocolumna sp.]|uniref:hypothetical protein n=1 Tax=Anaerocolumna sp. TaxID=2041569 RepID=UPI0028A7F6B2|nr:hypothetical protein [Anaerocolumna sp.]
MKKYNPVIFIKKINKSNIKAVIIRGSPSTHPIFPYTLAAINPGTNIIKKNLIKSIGPLLSGILINEPSNILIYYETNL